MSRDVSILEMQSKLADAGLVGFARSSVVWEGDHIRLALASRKSKGPINEVYSRSYFCLFGKIGCKCILDETKDVAKQRPV